MFALRMNFRSTVPCLASLWLAAAVSQAEEFVIENHPFVISKAFSATVAPGEGAVSVRIEPKSWSDFRIEEIASHAALLKKGDVLLRFETEAIDQKIADSRRAMASESIALSRATLELKFLQENSAHQLEVLQQAATTAKDENAYFAATRRKATEEKTKQDLELKKQNLENNQEELKQLKKMYEADDVTEETEEIILIRSKDAVTRAEFELRMQELETKRVIEISLPREAKSLANNEIDTAVALQKFQQDSPLALNAKKADVATLQATLDQHKETLGKLEKDRTLFEIKAPAEGAFYYGIFENGRWISSPETTKTLVKHGAVAQNLPCATFIPAKSSLTLSASLDETVARSLKTGLTGTATLPGREDVEIPVTLTALSTLPGAGSAVSYQAKFDVKWPEKLEISPGSALEIHLVAYQQAAAIAIPTKALAYGPDGWMAEVKLAEGKTERRPVKRGRISGETTEILSGLEIGQVLIVP